MKTILYETILEDLHKVRDNESIRRIINLICWEEDVMWNKVPSLDQHGKVILDSEYGTDCSMIVMAYLILKLVNPTERYHLAIHGSVPIIIGEDMMVMLDDYVYDYSICEVVHDLETLMKGVPKPHIAYNRDRNLSVDDIRKCSINDGIKRDLMKMDSDIKDITSTIGLSSTDTMTINALALHHRTEETYRKVLSSNPPFMWRSMTVTMSRNTKWKTDITILH